MEELQAERAGLSVLLCEMDDSALSDRCNECNMCDVMRMERRYDSRVTVANPE